MLHQCNHFHSAWKYNHLCTVGHDEASITKLCRHMSPFCKEIEEAHFNPRAENLKQKSVQMPHSCFPWTWKQEWLKLKMTWEEWGTICGRHKNTKPMNAICSHSIIQHLLLTLCHLHPFVLGHLRDFWDGWWVPNTLWIDHLLTICSSSKGECMGLVCSRSACTLPYFCLCCREAAG